MRWPRKALISNPSNGIGRNGRRGAVMISEQDIRDQLKRIPYPGSSRDILALGLVGEILTQDGTVIVHLRPSSATEEVLQHLTGRITSALSAVPGVQKVTIHAG